MKISDVAVQTATEKPDDFVENLQDETLEQNEVQQSGGFSFNLSWLKTETGPGEIEDYVTHPMNFNSSIGIAQALRGIAGFVGNGSQLKFAIIDVLFGLNRFRKDMKPTA